MSSEERISPLASHALALAIVASVMSFNAMAQTPRTYNFKVTFDGSQQSLDAGSDPVQGTTLNIGDKFLLDIRAAGSAFFESKTDNRSDAGIFPFASLLIDACATRTGNVTTKLVLDGTVVSQITELEHQQSCVHVGADFPPPPLTVGLRFDQILVEYELLASTSPTNVLQNGQTGEPVRWAGFANPDVFAFQQGVDVLEVASGLNFPFGVAVSSSGVLYIADHNNHRVLRRDQLSQEVLAGASPAEAPDDRYNGDGIDAKLALLDGPSGVAADAQGNVFIADSGNHIVRKVSIGGIITTVAGTPTDNSLDLEGAVLEVGNGGPATGAVLNGPRAVAVDGAGNLYIVDTIHQQVRKVDSSGNITVVAGVAGETGSNDGSGSCPVPAGTCIPARLNDPRGVAVDAAGNVYIADAGNDKIRKVTGNVVTTIAAGALDAPTGVAVGSDGTLFIADHNNNRIQRLSGTAVTTVPVTGLSGPYGVALDPSTGDLYIADKQNHRILKVDFTPVILLSNIR